MIYNSHGKIILLFYRFRMLSYLYLNFKIYWNLYSSHKISIFLYDITTIGSTVSDIFRRRFKIDLVPVATTMTISLCLLHWVIFFEEKFYNRCMALNGSSSGLAHWTDNSFGNLPVKEAPTRDGSENKLWVFC